MAQVGIITGICSALRRTVYTTLAALVLIPAARSQAQDTPLISGAVGYLSTTEGGTTFYQPVIAPVAVVPLGEHWLIESRADLRGFIAQDGNSGPYHGQFFPTLEYLQVDYLVNSKITITAGRFLTPFNSYDERLTPIWIRNFPEAPLIFPIGTRTSGSSDGGMIRGDLVSTDSVQLNYAAYFSAGSNVNQFQAGRSAGVRAGIFLPRHRLEVGASYERFLEDEHSNAAGLYIWWKPWSVPLQVRSEYAHAPHGEGYWIEGAYRLSQLGGEDSWIGRLQPMARVQQFFRTSPGVSDSLPSVDVNQLDLGLNYYFPDEIRLSTSYSRQFEAGGGDHNIWNIALTYRFLFPAIPGRKQ